MLATKLTRLALDVENKMEVICFPQRIWGILASFGSLFWFYGPTTRSPALLTMTDGFITHHFKTLFNVVQISWYCVDLLGTDWKSQSHQFSMIKK